jgi:hypothetical protein
MHITYEAEEPIVEFQKVGGAKLLLASLGERRPSSRDAPRRRRSSSAETSVIVAMMIDMAWRKNFIFTDADEFATFELGRLGFDVKSGKELFYITEDADDLLLLTCGDQVSQEVFNGMVWAIKNRPVNWGLHLDPANPPEALASVCRLLDAAGLSHLMRASASTGQD